MAKYKDFSIDTCDSIFESSNDIFFKAVGPTCAVLVDHGELPPFKESDHVQDGPGDGGVLGVQVDEEGVFVVHWRVFPAGLDVRHLQSVADGLDSADRGAVRRPEHGDHAQSQLVTH